jgi:hypothetical protein
MGRAHATRAEEMVREMADDETCLCSWVYAICHACLIVCLVMSAPTFMAVMLAVLSQRVELPEGDGRMLGSLSGQPGDAAYLVQS